MMRKTLLIAMMCMAVMLSLFVAECAADGDELEPGAVYFSDIKSQYSVSFYDNDNHCTIGGKSSLSGAVYIPSKVIVRSSDGVSSVQNGDPPKTYMVTEIGSFQNNKNITSITISDGIQKISGSAFLNCTGLTGDLTIPDSVISLGSQAFRGCTGLTGSLHLGSGITKIESNAFSNCGFTGQLVIPGNVTEIQNYAFQECKGFTGNLTIPVTVTSIGYDAFKGCTGFNGTLYLNCIAATRSGRTFSGCTGFTGLQIADGITSITNEEFYNCKGMIGSLTIPDSVTSISSSAFYGCSGFTGTLTIPSGVTVINGSAFRNCSGLTGLTLPAEVTTINGSAFAGCTGMTGTLCLPDTLKTVESSAFYQCGFTGNLTLPEGMTTIGGASFGCPGITGTLTIPSTITSSSQSAFSGMFGVKRIVNNSTSEFTLRSNFIADNDNETYYVKEGTTVYLTKYKYVSGNRVDQTIGQGTYYLNGVVIGDIIQFDANGGTGAPATQPVELNQPTVLPATIPTRTNWFFLGWETTQDAMAAAYLPGDSFTPTESTTFYAVWGQPDLVAPEDLMTIEEQAFAGSAFNFAALSAKTTAVQANAFAGCPNLVAVYIPAATMQINAQAFGEDRQSLPKLVLLGPANGAAQTFAQTYGFGFIPVTTSAE